MLPDDFDLGFLQMELVILSSEVQLDKPELPIFHDRRNLSRAPSSIKMRIAMAILSRKTRTLVYDDHKIKS